MITITLTDSTAAELRAALGASPVGVAGNPPVVTPTPTVSPTRARWPVSLVMPQTGEDQPWDADPSRVDRMFLWKMAGPYQTALSKAGLAGSHGVFEDMLTDRFGKTWRELVNQTTLQETPASQALKQQINLCKNDVGQAFAAQTSAFLPGQYTGPLRAIYNMLVIEKTARPYALA
jgi:hypothetical protein